ncbi:ABC transporter substrate-binding protein [Halalkalibacter okhensis]|uniref:ABC transporter substrate-binding protein n=1 Tax=Halalkalibacter okhensis TaxID=333138 RepID=UPI001F474FEB|nr:sugar ABC transporter substrate-binding protein [Halalkalibacter okhensis]
MIAFSVLLITILFLGACSGSDVANEETNDSSSNGGDGEGITLRVMDWSDSTRPIREEFHKQFMEKYPQVTNIEYTTLTQDQFRDTILAAVRSGEAPDLFPPPLGFKLPALVEDGWFQPLDPYVEEGFYDIFSEGLLAEGATMINGEVYAIPMDVPQMGTAVFYNKELFKKAGLDPEQPPKTYAEFREYARKITEAGNGEFYGMIEGGRQTNRWAYTARDWSAINGSGLSTASPVSLMTGEAPYHTDAVLDVFDLFAGLADDGSIHPQTSGLSAPEARQLFANGEAGFIIQGAWNIGLWNKENPELDYGVTAPPLPEGERNGSMNLTVTPGLGISANTEHPEEAALYLQEFYGGGFFQEEAVKQDFNFSVVDGISEEYASGKMLEFYEIYSEYAVLAPDPSSKPKATKVFSEYTDVSPNVGEILQAVAITGLRDYEPMLQELSKKTDAALTKAIEDAKANGEDVSIDDFTFSDWDPMSHHNQE